MTIAAPKETSPGQARVALAPETDVVITTALIPGRDAPVLGTPETVAAMKPGSVILDPAAERGGDCEPTRAEGRMMGDNGVIILDDADDPCRR